MTDLIVDEKAMIGLDRNDVKYVLDGKAGMLFEAQNEKNEDNGSFIKHFFDELAKRKEVVSCTYMLINFAMAEESPLTMDDMNNLNDFFRSIVNEEMEVKWGIRTNENFNDMAILVICTQEI